MSAVFIFCTEIILLLYLLYLESRFLESSALRVTSSRGKLLVGCCAFVSTLRCYFSLSCKWKYLGSKFTVVSLVSIETRARAG